MAALVKQVADRFCSSCSAQESGHGPAECANWPDDIRDLTVPLYARGLQVHSR